MKARNSLILLVVLAVAGAVAAQQRPDPDSPRFKAAMARIRSEVEWAAI